MHGGSPVEDILRRINRAPGAEREGNGIARSGIQRSMKSLGSKRDARVVRTAFHVSNHNPFDPNAEMIREAPDEVVAHGSGCHDMFHGEANGVAFCSAHPDWEGHTGILILEDDDAGIGVPVVQHLLDGQCNQLRGVILWRGGIHG